MNLFLALAAEHKARTGHDVHKQFPLNTTFITCDVCLFLGTEKRRLDQEEAEFYAEEERRNKSEKITEHHWSGWPGAFCLDCGADDQNEICVAEHSAGLTCIEENVVCQIRGHKLKSCPEHKQTECSRTKPNPNCGQCK